MSLTKFVGLLAGTALAGSALAASVDGGTDAMNEIANLKKEIAELKAANGDKWLTEQRETEIRAVVQDVLADADTRSSLQAAQATSGYNNGFFISSPDGNFKLQMNGQLQSRWAYNWLSTRDMTNSSLNAAPGANFNTQGVAKAAYGFEVRRAKLEFSGHISDPSWQYAATLAYQQFFGANGAGANGAGTAAGGGVSQGDNGNAAVMGFENLYVKKDLGNGFSVQVGQFKSPFLREWLVSSKYQLAVERSLVETLFSTGWTQGIQLNWNNDMLRVMASYNDGANNANLGSISGTSVNGTGPAGNGNSGVGFSQWAFTGRVEAMLSGNWAQFDNLTSMRGEGSGILVGGGINWQRGGQQTQTNAGNVPANGNADGEFFSWTLDATWDLGGANLYGAWVMNTSYSLPGGQGDINSYGIVVQGGYFITDAVELFARWEWMSTQNENTNTAGSDVSLNTPNSAFVNNIGTIGANWYMSKNVKWTTDFGVSWNPVTFQTGLFGQNIAGADYRTEGSNGGGQIVFRTQLQLLF
ncbi:MAG: porin [Phycisphaerales bacterium]